MELNMHFGRAGEEGLGSGLGSIHRDRKEDGKEKETIEEKKTIYYYYLFIYTKQPKAENRE